jgi:hypothetical protein
VQKWIVTVLVRLRNMAIGALQGSGFIHLFVGRLLQGDGNPGVACQACSIREKPLERIVYKKSMFKAYLTSATQIS